MSYLWGDIVDVLISPLSSLVLLLSWEIVNILDQNVSGTQSCWDVVDLLGGLVDHAPVSEIMLLRDRWRDIVYVLWNWRLVVFLADVVVQVMSRRNGWLGL